MRVSGNQRAAEIGVLLVLTPLFAVQSTGVVRAWRWTFWLILVAFMAGLLRVRAPALQLAGIVPGQGPAWYLVLQAVVGLIQFVIALAMLVGYGNAGVWSAFLTGWDPTITLISTILIWNPHTPLFAKGVRDRRCSIFKPRGPHLPV